MNKIKEAYKKVKRVAAKKGRDSPEYKRAIKKQANEVLALLRSRMRGAK